MPRRTYHWFSNTPGHISKIEMFHLTTPSPINPLGVKGAGEAGTLPVPAAVAGAVEDTLRPFEVRVNRMPLNPARISDLIHGA
jgi:carbon-monoxide dehydrogenase large subunit